MPHIPFHPAPGFGDLLPGNFVVPQNPIQGASTPMVPSVQAAAGGAVVYTPHIGELLPGKFSVPQNPIVYTMVTGQLAGLGGMGCSSCSGDGWAATNFYGMSGPSPNQHALDHANPHARFFRGASGLSGLGADDGFLGTLQAPNSFFPSVPNWAVYGGAALLAYMVLMPSGSEYRTKARALRSQYRGYRRIGRAAGEAVA